MCCRAGRVRSTACNSPSFNSRMRLSKQLGEARLFAPAGLAFRIENRVGRFAVCVRHKTFLQPGPPYATEESWHYERHERSRTDCRANRSCLFVSFVVESG